MQTRNQADLPTTPSKESSEESQTKPAGGTLRAVGLGLITGAADDDPSAIGTYASAGAQFGTAFLWAAPVTLPMMFAVVYLSAKLGQVAGEGLFAVLRNTTRDGCCTPLWRASWSGTRLKRARTWEV